MTALAPDLKIDAACAELADRAVTHGRVPVAWAWGPDVRAAWSAFLDHSLDPQAVALQVCEMFDPTPFTPPDDGRICDFAGLPAYPMVCEGVALRTVGRQSL